MSDLLLVAFMLGFLLVFVFHGLTVAEALSVTRSSFEASVRLARRKRLRLRRSQAMLNAYHALPRPRVRPTFSPRELLRHLDENPEEPCPYCRAVQHHVTTCSLIRACQEK